MNKKVIDWFTVVPSDTHAGGSETQLINLFKYLVAQGNNCLVICLSKKDLGCWEFVEKKGRVLYFPLSNKYLKISFILLYPVMAYIFISKNITYSFSTQSLINSSIGLCKRIGITGKTIIIGRESNSIFKLFKGIKRFRYYMAYKLGYSNIDLIVCQTEVMKNNLLDALPWLAKKTKVRVIPNPINLEDIKEQEQENLPDLDGVNYIIAAGSLTEKKGFDILINAFGRIHNNYPDLKLFILGKGPKEQALKNQINSLELQNKVFLKGFVGNVYPYFRKASVCVISSRIEGFPNVLLQMMSQNNSVVSTLSAGDIDNIEGIYTCPVNDEIKLAESIVSCLETDLVENKKLFNDYLKRRGTDRFVKSILDNL